MDYDSFLIICSGSISKPYTLESHNRLLVFPNRLGHLIGVWIISKCNPV